MIALYQFLLVLAIICVAVGFFVMCIEEHPGPFIVGLLCVACLLVGYFGGRNVMRQDAVKAGAATYETIINQGELEIRFVWKGVEKP